MNHIEETHEILKGLTKLYPEASEELGKFFKIHTSIKHFKLEPFIEPISIVEIENGKTSFITQLGFYQVTRPLAAVAHCYAYTRELLGGFLVRPR